MASFQYAWRGWILGALFAMLAWARWTSAAPLLPAGLLLVALGAAYRFQAGRFIPGHSNSLGMAADALATGGPYRFGRHPLYLSNLAVIAGLIVFANCLSLWTALAVWLGAVAHHVLLARAEEVFLLRTRGEAYRRYQRATPRWLGAPIAEKNADAATDGAATPETDESCEAAAATGGLFGVWSRQGANLGKTAACAGLLWALSVLGR